MGQRADYRVLCRYVLPQARLAPLLRLLHVNRHPGPLRRREAEFGAEVQRIYAHPIAQGGLVLDLGLCVADLSDQLARIRPSRKEASAASTTH